MEGGREGNTEKGRDGGRRWREGRKREDGRQREGGIE